MIAKDLGLSERGGYKLLEAARAKLDAFVKRHEAMERRLLGKGEAFLVPVGLAFHPKLWAARARLALGRALTRVKGVLMSVGASAGLAFALGAWMVPFISPSALAEEVTPKITAPVTAASVMPGAGEAPAPPMISAPPKAPSTKSVARPSSGVSKGSSALREQLALDSIQILVETDPVAALEALALHRKTFPREHHPEEREVIEAHARMEVAKLQARSKGIQSSPPKPPNNSASPQPYLMTLRSKPTTTKSTIAPMTAPMKPAVWPGR